MMDPKRVARIRGVQADMLKLRKAEWEESERLKDVRRHAWERWTAAVSRAVEPRAGPSPEWTVWRMWAVYADGKARESEQAWKEAEEESARRRALMVEQWRSAKVWANLEQRVVQNCKRENGRREEKVHEDLFTARFRAERDWDRL